MHITLHRQASFRLFYGIYQCIHLTLTISNNLSIYIFFDINVRYLKILFFKIPVKLAATADFSP